jgi:hypothetical protein
MTTGRHSTLVAILLGGFVAGTIDIGAATLISGRGVVFILHAIAGGVLGMASFKEGAGAAALGLLLQWAMSLIIAAIYVLAASRSALLRRWWIVGGLAYGVGIFFVMNYVVVPLSAYHDIPHFKLRGFALNMLAMLLFGLIVAGFAKLSARR